MHNMERLERIGTYIELIYNSNVREIHNMERLEQLEPYFQKKSEGKIFFSSHSHATPMAKKLEKIVPTIPIVPCCVFSLTMLLYLVPIVVPSAGTDCIIMES